MILFFCVTIRLKKNFETFEVLSVYCNNRQFEIFEVIPTQEKNMSGLTRKDKQVLLAVYQLRDDAYLIPIREEIRRFTGKVYSVGTIYAPLNRLHINGYLESYMKKVEIPGGGKPIKCYKMTRKGYEALAELKRQDERMWDGFIMPALDEE